MTFSDFSSLCVCVCVSVCVSSRGGLEEGKSIRIVLQRGYEGGNLLEEFGGGVVSSRRGLEEGKKVTKGHCSGGFEQ